MRLSDRVLRISESPTISVSSKAAAMRAQGIDVIDFSAGEPDFPTPENIKARGIEAIRQNFTKYTPTAGIKILREAIAKRYNSRYGSKLRAEEVIVCNGAKQALFNLLFSLAQEGDEVLIPEPYWVTFPEQVLLSGADPVYVPTHPEKGFVIQAEDVEKKITPRTRVLILNSPNNPSGAVIPANTLSDIMDVCAAKDIAIIFDECYDTFVFPPLEHVSPLKFHDKAQRNCFVVNTFSKVYAMTGWRLGFAIGNPEVISAGDRLQGHSTSNPSSISQMAGVEALEGDQSSVQLMYNEYMKRRKFISAALQSMPGIECNEPQGAFYVFPSIKKLLNSETPDSVSFCHQMLEVCRVATVPGSAFGMEGHFRLSYATSLEKLEAGCLRISEFLASRT